LGQGNRSVRQHDGRQALARRRGVESVSVHHYYCEENRARSASYHLHGTLLRSSDARAKTTESTRTRISVLSPSNVTLQPRRFSITPSADGCKRLLGRCAQFGLASPRLRLFGANPCRL